MTADTSKRAAGGKDISAARRGEISLDGRVLSSLLCTADVQTNSRRRCPARSEALRDSPPPEAAFGAQDIRTGRRRLGLAPRDSGGLHLPLPVRAGGKPGIVPAVEAFDSSRPPVSARNERLAAAGAPP